METLPLPLGTGRTCLPAAGLSCLCWGGGGEQGLEDHPPLLLQLPAGPVPKTSTKHPKPAGTRRSHKPLEGVLLLPSLCLDEEPATAVPSTRGMWSAPLWGRSQEVARQGCYVSWAASGVLL